MSNDLVCTFGSRKLKHMDRLDVMLLIPFDDPSGIVLDPIGRRVIGGRFLGLVMGSLSEFEERVGHPLSLLDADYPPLFGGAPFRGPKHRSLAAVTLGTHLERAGLKWYVVDPGSKSLGYWRKRLLELRHLDPKVVGISTTFVSNERWIAALLKLTRQLLPRAKLVIGGYFYGTDAKAFLSFDADVFCVGEGEIRFPQIVRALVDDKPLDGIAGLYLPNPGGGLRYTGRAEPLNLSALPPVDWTLASRIDPPLDIKRDFTEVAVETQRGCAFKCGFCTFRTLASPNLMTPDKAVDAILNLDGVRYAGLNIMDATATYPHQRWEEVLRGLIARGGSRLPMWCYARVNDISPETAALMAQAGVRQIFLGQESGDQRMLNLMRKGTNISHVTGAISAVARNRISVILALIHGYPGETLETLENTRRLLLTINDPYKERLPVPLYGVWPFALADYAGAGKDDRLLLEHERHAFEYRSGEFTSDFWGTECARTVLFSSRVDHAPVHHIFYSRDNVATLGIALASHPYQTQVFRWLKLLERGTGVFLGEQLERVKPKGSEIDSLRRELDTFYDVSSRPGALVSAKARLRGLVVKTVIKRMTKEWSVEQSDGPGPLTRLVVGGLAMEATGDLGTAIQAAQLGSLSELSGAHVAKGEIDGSLARLAEQSIGEGIENGKQRLRMLDSSGRVVPLKKRELSESDAEDAV